MKLYYSPSSPFARKVLACAMARGIDDKISLVTIAASAPEVAAHNPLGKIPCLVTDDNTALYDSRVICAYLEGVGEGFPMFPDHGLRIQALKYQALGDGICDAAVLRRGEMGRAKDADRDTVIAAQKTKVARALDALEADVPPVTLNIGSIALACALGYLDLRYADEPWREGHPLLAAWYNEIITRPCLAQTMPG